MQCLSISKGCVSRQSSPYLNIVVDFNVNGVTSKSTVASILRTCPNSTPCPPDAPLDNFSAEADDTLDYISSVFAQNPPPLLHNFDATACGETYVSQISQLDADLQAAAQALQCVYSHLDPTPTLFTNAPQTCCVPCPDGTNTCYQVPGGLIPGPSQAAANSAAYTLACSLVKKNPICLGSIPGCTCVGSPYGAIITSTVPATFTIAGSVPPGVAISTTANSVVLLGMPTFFGTYVFQVTAQTATGPYMIKTFSITVLQVITTSLPFFSVGVPYSFQLQAEGGSGNYAWKIASGSLPSGLTLSLSGLISGTPTALNGSNPLVFEVIDTVCESVDQTFFPPAITLTTKSTTQIATILGFPEYQGFISSPPKRYRKLTWTGSSEQTLFGPPTPAYTYVLTDAFGTNQFVNAGGAYEFQGKAIGDGGLPFNGQWTLFYNDHFNTLYLGPNPFSGPVAGVYTKFQGDPAAPATITVTGPFTQAALPAVQIAGAKVEYQGSSEIDFTGDYSSVYKKNLSEMCTKADKLCMGINPNSGAASYNILGWLGPTGATLCPPPGIPYAAVGDIGVKKGDAAIYDSGPLGSGVVFSGGFVNFTNTFAIQSATTAQNVAMGSQANLLMLTNPIACSSAAVGANIPCTLNWNHNYNAALDEEYTDADALTNAQVIQSNGAVAQNIPRTTGFVSVFTNVVYTLAASNLIPGTFYTVTVDLADVILGTVTTKTYSVLGNATGTATITDIIPTPLPNGQTQVRNATISFT